jgi:hypothetical protein
MITGAVPVEDICQIRNGPEFHDHAALFTACVDKLT